MRQTATDTVGSFKSATHSVSGWVGGTVMGGKDKWVFPGWRLVMHHWINPV
jgi:hypothetical protein